MRCIRYRISFKKKIEIKKYEKHSEKHLLIKLTFTITF